MGVSLFKLSSSVHDNYRGNLSNDPNPNPSNFKILEYIEIKKHLVLVVKYIGCTNYEGKKILVYANTTYNEIKQYSQLDPHFHDDRKSSFKSPIARFAPTDLGLQLAQQLVAGM